MRPHLLKIFKSKIIEHFPQDSRYGVPHKVLPLASIRVREAEATQIKSNIIKMLETNDNIALPDSTNSQVFIDGTNITTSSDDSGHQIDSNNEYNMNENKQVCDYSKLHALHEKNRYNQNLQHSRAEKRRRYTGNADNILEVKRRRYRENVENILDVKRRRDNKDNQFVIDRPVSLIKEILIINNPA
ncbi:hypothetical protein PV327_003007 [Microctonus hyperodae]|uniref:Uncharacterized protein n=1 Tax=Microctonus hyperodae TaxID=165561 RepID=A0AA39G341_MICHY|nr:hypothetical protein PV327_003007 [Microctonus hyperodae]